MSVVAGMLADMVDIDSGTWFVGVLEGGEVAVPELREPLILEAVPRGDIEIRSGTLRVADSHRFAHSSGPLDASFRTGLWNVTSLVAVQEGGSGLGTVAEIVRFGEVGSADVTWELATANGETPRFAWSNVIIGDGDLSLALDDGPAGRSYPRMPVYVADGEPLGDSEAEELRAWRRDRDRGIGRLLPGSSVDTYQAHGGPIFPTDLADRLAFPRLWLGVDSDQNVAVVVVDHLAAFWGADNRRMRRVEDAWSERMGLPGGVLTVDETILRPERADIASLFRRATGVGRAFELGRVRLAGQLSVASASRSFLRPDAPFTDDVTDLPVRVPDREYPTYLVEVPQFETHLVAIRFADGYPSRWLRLDESRIGVGRTGRFLISGQELVRATEDDATRQALHSACEWLNVDIVETTEHGGALVDTVSGGLEPDAWYVGLSEDGILAALVVAFFQDPVYAVRPPAEDRPILEGLRELRLSPSGLSETDREEFLEDWEVLEEDLGPDGSDISPQTRAQLQLMAERYIRH